MQKRRCCKIRTVIRQIDTESGAYYVCGICGIACDTFSLLPMDGVYDDAADTADRCEESINPLRRA